jgi:hypothetical protein
LTVLTGVTPKNSAMFSLFWPREDQRLVSQASSPEQYQL